MVREINDRLSRLKTRRRGTDRLNRVAFDAQRDIIAKSVLAEGYQSRAQNQPYTQYALGAMQEVGPDYTRISVETAERVGSQLLGGLAGYGIIVEFRLQGSVPLNVHIRGVSDVDLLTLDTNFWTYAQAGIRARTGGYTSPTARTSSEALSELRTKCETILRAKYPAATVDTWGGKAINVSGGSLQRPVDVVPSHWYDTVCYQDSRQECDRAVTIYDKKADRTIDNWPFLHIKRIHDRDIGLYGGLRKAIRLCKNVKADAEEEGTVIEFPSFDIAAAMYHADQHGLRIGYIYELGILAEVQKHLDFLTLNETYAKSLDTPDGTRKIFNTPEKLIGLRRLSIEMDDLAREVAKEQSLSLRFQDTPSLPDSREVLTKFLVAS